MPLGQTEASLPDRIVKWTDAEQLSLPFPHGKPVSCLT